MSNFYIKFQVFKCFLSNRQLLHKTTIVGLTNLFKRFHGKSITRPLRLLNKKSLVSLAACGVFSWDENRIDNNEIRREINDIMQVFRKDETNDTDKKHSNRIDFEASRNFEDNEWTKIYDKKDLLIWRRKIGFDDANGLDIFEHKVLGRIDDLTPIEFYQTQIDIDYRKEWDFLVKYLEVVKRDPVTNTELLQWVSKFPYPLSDREYIFVRRYCIEPTEKLLVLVSRALSEMPDDLPATKNTVQVTQYKSNMIIIPYSDIDKPGIYYIIQYYDVNKAKIPRLAYKWMATSGLPDYVSKLHKATLNLRDRNEDESDANFLDIFDLFYMNEVVEPVRSEFTSESKSDTKNLEKTDQIVPEKSKPEEALISKEEMDFNDVVPMFLKDVTRKLNEDYFNEYEPHPIFHHY